MESKVLPDVPLPPAAINPVYNEDGSLRSYYLNGSKVFTPEGQRQWNITIADAINTPLPTGSLLSADYALDNYNTWK